MARALLDGHLDVWSFSPDKLTDPAACRLAERVSCSAEVLPEFPAAFPARVTVRLKNGTTHAHYVGHNLGTPGNPMSAADIGRKFDACAIPALGETRAASLSALIDAIGEKDGAQALFEQLRITAANN